MRPVARLCGTSPTALLGILLAANAAAAEVADTAAASASDVTPVLEDPSAPTEPEVAASKARRRRSIGSAGMDTQSTSKGGVTEVGDTTSEKDWGFRFKGYFRAPMRLGIDASGSQLHALDVH
jgi:opacity protein-like surface antigen